MSSPKMTRMFGFFCVVCALAGAAAPSARAKTTKAAVPILAMSVPFTPVDAGSSVLSSRIDYRRRPPPNLNQNTRFTRTLMALSDELNPSSMVFSDRSQTLQPLEPPFPAAPPADAYADPLLVRKSLGNVIRERDEPFPVSYQVSRAVVGQQGAVQGE